MEIEFPILLGLVLIIISLLAVSRCSLSCSCDREKFLNGLPFNDHPVLRRHKRYQHTIAPVSAQNSDASYHATCKEEDDNEVCVCAQCDDEAKTCTSKTCTTFDDAQKCCTNSSLCDSLGCTDDTGPCNYNQWCVGSHDEPENGGDKEENWIIVTISVLVAIALGVAFYFWMTTKHVD